MSCTKSDFIATEREHSWQQKSMRKGLDATSGAQFATDCHYGQEGFFICTDPLNWRPIFFFATPA